LLMLTTRSICWSSMSSGRMPSSKHSFTRNKKNTCQSYRLRVAI
jgi:hypothetical protein